MAVPQLPVPYSRRGSSRGLGFGLGLLILPALTLACYQGTEAGGDDTSTGLATGASASAGASVGESAGESEGESEGESGDDAAAVIAGPTGLRLLTPAQYRNSMIEVLGEVAAPAVGQWRSSIAAAQGGVAVATVENYEEAAIQVTAELFADPDARFVLTGCVDADEACVTEVLATLGRRAWRRPLTAEELGRYTAAAAEIAGILGGDPWLGLQHAVAGLLQSPNFLYRVELGAPVGDDRPELVRLDGYELASRISYLIWNSTPDEALLEAASRGELDDPASLAPHIDRLLESPRSRDGVLQLFVDMLDLDVLLHLQKHPELPGYSPTIGLAMREELLRLIGDTVIDQGDYRRLFDARSSFINAELAALYGIEGAFDETFLRVALPDHRAGLLTLGGFLAINSGEASTSPTIRGLTIRRALMCQTIPPPPPDVEPELPQPSDDTPMTKREQLDAHVSDPACAACHQFTDPIGLALENFTAIGVYRTTEYGLPIDPSGDLDGAPFADAVELGDLFTEHAAVADCLTRNLYRYAAGHIEDPTLVPLIVDLRAALVDSGYDLRAAIDTLVRSDSFRYATRSPEDAP